MGNLALCNSEHLLDEVRQLFFLLAPQSGHAKTMLTFYRGQDGALRETFDLDPIDIVPYDREKYVVPPRDRFCLVNSPTMGSVGALLDTWSDVRFDQSTSTLLLAVLRPVSAPYREEASPWCIESELHCKVEQRWVAVELSA